MFWLHPRLKAFSFSDAACDVNSVTTESTSELLTEAQNLAIVYCDGNLPGWECIKVVDVEMVPVATPDVATLAERANMFSGQPPDKSMPPLLEYANLTPDWINWRVWLRRLKLPNKDQWSCINCNSYVQSIGKAIEGEGVALVTTSLMEQELKSGTLVRIGNKSLKPRKSYYLCKRQNVSLPENAQTLYSFLSA